MAFMHGCRLCLIRLSTPCVNMLLSESATVEGGREISQLKGPWVFQMALEKLCSLEDDWF
jgi:hypothetical protein